MKRSLTNLQSQLFLCLFFLFNINPVFCQWTQQDIGIGGAGIAVEKSIDKIWLGTTCGLYYSSDEGINWDKSSEFGNSYIHQLFANQDTIIVIVSDASEFVEQIFSRTSFDNGATWTDRQLVNENRSFFLHGINLFKIKSTIYVHGEYQETYVSNDFGLSWSIFQTDQYRDRIVTFDKNGFIFYNTNNLNEINYFYFDGTTSLATQIEMPTQYDGLVLHDNNIFITTSNLAENKSNVFKSPVLENNYELVAEIEGITFLSLSRIIGDKFYLHNSSETIISEDNGITWNLSPSFPKILRYDEFVLDPSDNVIVPSDTKSVSKFTPDFSTSIPINFNFHNKPVYDVYNLSGIIFALSENGLIKDEEGNNQWTNVLPGITDIRAAISSGDTIIFFNNDFFQQKLEISLDKGQTWISRNLPFDVGSVWKSSMVLQDEELIIMTEDVIYSTTDLGITWVPLPSLPNISMSGCIENDDKAGMISYINGDLWTVTQNGYAFKFKKSSNNWEYKTCTWSPGVNLNNRILYLDGNYVAIISGELSISSDGSNFIKPNQIGRPKALAGYFYSLESIVSNNNIWYATFEDSGIYYTADHGDHWFALEQTPFLSSTKNLICHDNDLITGSIYAGLWKRNLTTKLIKGKVFRDYNNNGLFDNEDIVLPNINLKTSISGHFATTNINGEYAIPVNQISDTLKVIFSSSLAEINPNYYIVSNNADTLDFSLYFKENILDGSISLTNNNVFRPGFNTTITATVQNNGSSEIPFNVKITLDPQLSFVSAEPAGYTLNNDTITWLTGLLKYGDYFNTYIEVNTPTVVALGETINCIASLSPFDEDIHVENNIDSLVSIVVGSYDPNDKSCNAGTIIHPELLASGEDLEYTIRFQNTGTFSAENVHIRDVLDSKLDPTSLRILSFSHQMSWRLSEKGQVDFYFDNINLPDSNLNEVKSHGFVKYAIKAKTDFKLKDQIENTAFIYFDFNDAIVTNTVITTIDYPAASHPLFRNKNSIIVYPNPTNSGISFKTDNRISDQAKVKIMDINGKVIKTQNVNTSNNFIELHGLIPGIYMGIVSDLNGENLGNFKFIFR